MKTSEEKVQKIIDDADAAFSKENYSYTGNYKLYLKENSRCEFLKVHLKSALDNLGKIVGETTSEEILDIIFSKFCIGK